MSNSFKTFLKHTAKDFHNQSVNPPVVRASTIIFKSMKDIRKTQAKAIKNPTGGHYDYGRQGTSTTYILQKILTKLEESYHVFTTPTGFGAVFLAIFLGWRTNCFPLRVPSLLALVVAAYSAGVKDLIAFSGKYLSPVFKEGLPDLVRQFCFDHALRLF